MRGNIPIPEIPFAEDLWLMVAITSLREKRTQQGKRSAQTNQAVHNLDDRLFGMPLRRRKKSVSLLTYLLAGSCAT